jgi:hypothetical protein
MSVTSHKSLPAHLDPDHDSPACNPLLLPDEQDFANLIASSLLLNKEGFRYFLNDETEELVPGECPPQPMGTTITVTLNCYASPEARFPYPTKA